MTKQAVFDITVGLFFIILALIGIFFLIPSGIVRPGGVEIAALSPSFWPKLVMCGLAIAGAIILFQGIFPPADRDDIEIVEFSLPWPVIVVKLLTAVVVLFIYYFSIEYIGIVIASIATLIALMLLGGESRLKILLPVAVLLPVFLFFFFTYVANVPLPMGFLER